MNRRRFFKNSAFGMAAGALTIPGNGFSQSPGLNQKYYGKSARNIIFMVSDGMSSGTLQMADLMLRMRDGRGSHWINLYRENRAPRALMDMSSASSAVTDSAAASSSWGGGFRVKNGRLNTGPDGQEYLPILQKFKWVGKKVGCVTTVPITHATPAGFCVSSKSRGEQAEIAEKYLNLRFDVMMGGGAKYFTERKDGRNLFDEYKSAGFQLVEKSSQLSGLTSDKPVMAVFDKEGLPFELDRLNTPELKSTIPSLAEMTQKAIELMKDNVNGFCLQVEAGKVDWAAHANDAAGLLYDQIAFDDAVRVALDFAEKDKETLVVITTDHGNANPGLFDTDKADEHFARLFSFKHTNDWVLKGLNPQASAGDITDRMMFAQGYQPDPEQLAFLVSRYAALNEKDKSDGYKLPFREYGQYQSAQTYVGFGSTDHSSDFTELAMVGPGSELLPSFIMNTDLHYFLLKVAEVENKF
jgi:alkaline phosphatase